MTKVQEREAIREGSISFAWQFADRLWATLRDKHYGELGGGDVI